MYLFIRFIIIIIIIIVIIIIINCILLVTLSTTDVHNSVRVWETSPDIPTYVLERHCTEDLNLMQCTTGLLYVVYQLNSGLDIDFFSWGWGGGRGRGGERGRPI